MADTLLVISGNLLPDYSARGLTQSLRPIEAASQLRRTVNGNLQDLAPSQFQKYRSTIGCDDQRPPAWDGIWPGQTVTVDCVHELAYVTSGGSPDRTVVTGSSRVEGAFTFYRPRLTMKVVDFNGSFAEWEAGQTWSIDLEEA